ncbi:hypothetical protein BGY98DRAFT_1052272, partial [Russula aff. rugulosa BPL654]
SRPTGSATLPRLRPRGLVNTGNICFANAVLQLACKSPSVLEPVQELGDLKAQRGAGLLSWWWCNTTVGCHGEILQGISVEEGSPSTQQRSQPATAEHRGPMKRER